MICTFPAHVITGLGHATDHTLLDEVAWQSADTPSKAIGLVLTLIREWADQVMIDHSSIRKEIDRTLHRQSEALSAIRDQVMQDVEARLRQQEYEICIAGQSISTCQTFLCHRLSEMRQDLNRLLLELTGKPVAHNLALEPVTRQPATQTSLSQTAMQRKEKELARLRQDIFVSLEQALEWASLSLEADYREVQAFSVESILARGFALVLDHNRHPVRQIGQISSASLTLTLADGTVMVRCDDFTSSAT